MNPQAYLSREQLLRLLDGGKVQLATSVGMLELNGLETQPAWTPLTKHPHGMGDAARKATIAAGSVPADEVWSNDLYEVLVYTQNDGFTHLSIKRFDRAPIRNWRHFQQMKNEICGDFAEGVELFPGEHRIADNANQYHLWVLPEGVDLPIGWPQGMVIVRDDEVALFNDAPHKGRQEPMQPGLTVGKRMDEARGDDNAMTSTVRSFLKP